MSYGAKLTVVEQVAHMKKLNIGFSICKEDEAQHYLEEHNNYFKIRAYRKNYEKNGAGEYIGLEFAYLKDIAIIDMHLRYLFLEMCLDIEHTARMRVIKAIVDSTTEDGYSVVDDFRKQNENLYDEIADRASKSVYCSDLQGKYQNGMPVWVLVEMMQYSSLCIFYRFVADRLNNQQMKRDYYLFQEIRQLRNACAHSNCILNDLKSMHPSKHQADLQMLNELSKISEISRDVRRRKMSNDRVRQMTSLLYCYQYYVQSEGLKKQKTKELHEVLFERVNRHRDYYASSEPIRTTMEFLQKVVDKWYPLDIK